MFNKRESENMVTKTAQQFPTLESVTKPNLTTRELAHYSNMAEQTWRVKACYDTAPEGLRPLRVCGKLAWPTAGAKKLLLGVKRILRKYKYPPDLQDGAVELVLQQAQVMGESWAL